MSTFVMLKRGEVAEELILHHPNAFLLLTLIALRARRTPNMIRNLDVCECHLGDFKACGLTRQQYRTAQTILEKLNFATFCPTNKGTIAKIINTDIYDINPEGGNQQDNHQATIKQPSANHQLTTNNNVKKENNEKKVTPDSDESGFYKTKKNRKLSGKRLETFNQFWQVFNFKKDKANAADSWLDIPTLTDALVIEILSAAKIEAENRQALIDNGSSPKWAQGWLTSRRWEDETTTPETTTPESDVIEYEFDEHGRPIF